MIDALRGYMAISQRKAAGWAAPAPTTSPRLCSSLYHCDASSSSLNHSCSSIPIAISDYKGFDAFSVLICVGKLISALKHFYILCSVLYLRIRFFFFFFIFYNFCKYLKKETRDNWYLPNHKTKIMYLFSDRMLLTKSRSWIFLWRNTYLHHCNSYFKYILPLW